jgi:CRISPR-associated protein Csh1
MTRATFHNMMKYRKAMYDFVYKSKREVLTAHMLYSIVMSECYDRIRTNVDRDKALSTGYLVVDLLNTLFSLHSYFGGNLMPSMITKQREHIRSVLHDGQILSGDENFAYAAGQLIYYILEKSKSETKTHAMLEPFLNKREMQLFRLAITRSIEQYKHAFDWYGTSGKGRFEVLAAQVLSYDAETKIEDLHPHLLAGYFDTSLIYEKKQDSTNNSQTNISEGE